MSSSAACGQLSLFAFEDQRRCIAKNRKGRRCLRLAKPSSDFCSQHERQIPKQRGRWSGQRFETVEDYLESLSERRKDRFYDHNEIKKIANVCGISNDDARAGLKRCGYVKTTNKRDIIQWVREK